MNGTSKELVGVYKEITPINSIYQGNLLVWGGKKPILINRLTGKFIDSSTESRWWYYPNGRAHSDDLTYLEVDADTKLFDIEMELEGNCGYMFFDNGALERIDNLPITNKVTTMSRMFYYCSNLTSINTSGWDLSEVTAIDYLFNECQKLTSIDVKDWDIRNVKYLIGVFYNCKSLQTIDVSGWDTTNVESISSLFQGCSGLTEIDITNFRTDKCTIFNSIFYSCSNLETIKFGEFYVGNARQMSYPFALCNKLKNVTGKFYGIKDNISLQWCPLTNDSAMVFINGLEQVTTEKTITFKASTYNTLTDEQKAIATNKGWTIAKV